jgi:MinD superfamily P-loop ATPase
LIIRIASGKGGKGKTTVATDPAFSLESKVQVLDCDVEEPNSYLFIRPTIEEVKTITTPAPEVSMDKMHSVRKMRGNIPFQCHCRAR